MHNYALKCIEMGLSVVPPREDGSKAPIEKWQRFQHELPTEDDLARWYDRMEYKGIGFVTGQVSGCLEVLDFDSAAHFPLFCEWLEGYAGKPLVDRITVMGCVESTPKGVHLYYYCDGVEKNRKLASDANGKVRIETRGEGGYIVAAPSNGKINPAGKYAFVHNNHLSIPTITRQEREDIMAVAGFFDEGLIKKVKPYSGMPKGARPLKNGIRPGDDYNIKGNWQELLEGAGWKYLFEARNTAYLIKPGSSSRTHHATLNHNGSDLFYCFSSAAYPFVQETSYSKFAVYTLLYHNGDFEEAAAELARLGYGTQEKSQIVPWHGGMPSTDVVEDDHFGRKWSGADLMATEFKPLQYLCKPILPLGSVVVLAGSPKVGKSFFMLDLCLCCDSEGQRMLFDCYKVAPAGVLYLALEDSPESIKERMIALARPMMQFGRHMNPSAKLQISFEWPRLGYGCLERIEQHLEFNPDCKLVIIDTLQLVRPPERKGINAYSEDYNIVATFRKFASKHGITIILMTHLRKGDGHGDPFEEVTGSMGISGAADSTIILKRPAGETRGKLYTRGRRVEDQAILLEFHDCRWHYINDRDWGQVQHAQEIVDMLLEQNKWLTAGDIARLMLSESGVRLGNPRRTLMQLVDKDVLVKEGIKYNVFARRSSR